MYVSLMAVIFTGILNMIWLKLPILMSTSVPLDGGKVLKDGRRLFGENKTLKGLIGYVLWGVICTVLWGLICGRFSVLSESNYFYRNYSNTVTYNCGIGFLLGLAFSLFELPNSFIKRRLEIKEGKTKNGMMKFFFIFMDQADSIFGCVLVLSLVYKMSVGFYFGYVLVGAFTHIIMNMLLYAVKLRKNMF
jgi:hypothetical protein